MPPASPNPDDRNSRIPETPPAASSAPPRPDGAAPSPEEDAPMTPEVRASLIEEEYEKELFGQIMSGAREQATPLRELRTRADALAVPGKHPQANDASVPAARAGGKEASWSDELDISGNPRWITLSLPEREPEKDRITPESVLPPSLKISPEKPNQQKDEQRRQQPSGLLQSFLARLKLRPQPASDNVHPYARRARPMRSFFRMLLVTAILAMVYHIISLRGWAPRLF